MTPSPRATVLGAFGAVYLFWGSTYLFIKYAVASIPALGMAGARFFLAGLILYAFARWRGAERPRGAHWRSAIIVGAMLMTSNAGVAWSEQFIPSGVASLLVAMTPCWMVLFDWKGARERRPHPGVMLGLLGGVAGVAILIGPADLLGGTRIHLPGAAAVLIGTITWSAGSLYARQAPRPPSATLLSGMQMMSGGAILTVLAAASGTWSGFSLAATPPLAIWSFVYLLTFGSIVSYSAYMYLLTVSTPARVSTYAYVNPVVAVLLGWAFAGESLTPRMAIAAGMIVAAVALIVTFGASARSSRRATVHTDEFPAATTDAV